MSTSEDDRTDTRAFLKITGSILIICPVAVVLPIYTHNAGLLIDILTVVFQLAGYVLFLPAILALLYVIWRSLKARVITKMEAGWWLSMPYTLTYMVCLRLIGNRPYFLYEEMGIFSLPFIGTIFGALAWSVFALCWGVLSLPDLRDNRHKVGLASIALFAVQIVASQVWPLQ